MGVLQVKASQLQLETRVVARCIGSLGRRTNRRARAGRLFFPEYGARPVVAPQQGDTAGKGASEFRELPG